MIAGSHTLVHSDDAIARGLRSPGHHAIAVMYDDMLRYQPQHATAYDLGD